VAYKDKVRKRELERAEEAAKRRKIDEAKKVEKKERKKTDGEKKPGKLIEIVNAVQVGGGPISFMLRAEGTHELVKVSRKELLDEGNHMMLIEFYERHMKPNGKE
jgi:hypothetical protein